MKIEKIKVLKITPDKFSEKYYSEELEYKFGNDWMEEVIKELEEKGIKVEFDYS
jgi:hypothetical protein